MGQDPGTAGTQVDDEQRDPEEIRDDIESTRREMGDTVEALAQRTDVKAQAKEKVAEAKSSVMSKKDDLTGKAREASPESATSAAAQVSQKARENPVPIALVGAFAAGVVAGRVLKR